MTSRKDSRTSEWLDSGVHADDAERALRLLHDHPTPEAPGHFHDDVMDALDAGPPSASWRPAIPIEWLAIAAAALLILLQALPDTAPPTAPAASHSTTVETPSATAFVPRALHIGPHTTTESLASAVAAIGGSLESSPEVSVTLPVSQVPAFIEHLQSIGPVEQLGIQQPSTAVVTLRIKR